MLVRAKFPSKMKLFLCFYIIKKMFWGETNCQSIVKSTGNACTNQAYYKVGGSVYCGVHSKKENREILPTNPNKEAMEKATYKKHIREVKKVARANGEQSKKGEVTVTKLRMMNPDIDITMKTNMSAGHFSDTDRYAKLKEKAWEYTTLLDAIE